MTNKSKDNKSKDIEKLNRLGEEWSAAAGDGRKALEGEIFTLVLALFKKVCLKNTDFPYLEGIADVWEKDWPRFDASRGTLYGFFARRLHDRAVDLYRKERRNLSAVSLDAPTGTDENERAVTMLDTQGQEDVYPVLEQNRVTELLSQILRFPERLHGHAANPERLNYYRMFFTDGVSDALRKGALNPDQIPHERELLEIMKKRFLDFYLARICRSAAEIQDCPLKAYGELVAGRPMEEPKRPLPNDVYVTYLKTREGKTKTDSAISNQRKAYKAMLREILGDILK